MIEIGSSTTIYDFESILIRSFLCPFDSFSGVLLLRSGFSVPGLVPSGIFLRTTSAVFAYDLDLGGETLWELLLLIDSRALLTD